MQLLRTSAVAFGWLAVLTTFSCSRPEPGSPIVEKVEQAGSGTLTAVSKDEMREWLGKHKDVAYRADEMCKPVRLNATAMRRRPRSCLLALWSRDRRRQNILARSQVESRVSARQRSTK